MLTALGGMIGIIVGSAIALHHPDCRAVLAGDRFGLLGGIGFCTAVEDRL